MSSPVRPTSEPDEACETWIKAGAMQATIQVNGKAASINEW